MDDISAFLFGVKGIKLKHLHNDLGLCWCANQVAPMSELTDDLQLHMENWLGGGGCSWITEKVAVIDDQHITHHRLYVAIANQIRIDWLDASIAQGKFADLPTDDEVKAMLKKAREV